MSSQRLIAPGATIVVTGANGYIASHVINRLLADGYKVRGTVRAEKPWLDEHFASQYGKDSYESIVVPTLENEALLDKAFQGVEGVVHVVSIEGKEPYIHIAGPHLTLVLLVLFKQASTMSWSPDPQAVIPPTVAMMLGVLKAASRSNSVKRVVATSSVVATYRQNFDLPIDGDFEVDTGEVPAKFLSRTKPCRCSY